MIGTDTFIVSNGALTITLLLRLWFNLPLVTQSTSIFIRTMDSSLVVKKYLVCRFLFLLDHPVRRLTSLTEE